jgi:hypothetical protein
MVPGPRVVVLYEDKTSGGLHHLVRTMVTMNRSIAGRDPFEPFEAMAMKGNGNLIKGCSKFDRLRFGGIRADHVVAVIDAYEVENVVPGVPHPPVQRDDLDSFDSYCQELDRAVRGRMRDLAFGRMNTERRQEEGPRFHPLVLFWERESIFLAGADTLRETRKLELPEDRTTASGILHTRCPTYVIESAFQAATGKPYKKQVNGPQLFGDLASDFARWPTVLDRVPSLKEIVDTLVAL